MAKLVAEEGIQKGLVLSLNEEETVIGRDPSVSQIIIEDPSVSRKHIICRRTPQGETIENLSTTNLALVNDEELREPRLLRNGDLVKIGEGLYRFYAEDEAQLLDKGEVSQMTTQNTSNGNTPKEDDVPSKEDELTSFDQDFEDLFYEDKPTESEESVSPEVPQKPQPINKESIADDTEGNEAPLMESQEKQAQESEEEIDPKPTIEESDNSDENREVNTENQEIESIQVQEKSTEDSDQSTESLDNPTENEINKNAELASLQKPEEAQEEVNHLEDNDHISIFEDIFGDEKSQFPHINFDLTETSRWLLKVINGPNHGAEFSMQPASTYIIGTDPNSCDIVFHDTSVSRQHAKVTLNEDGSIVLEDLKSRNGTLVDGKKVEGKETIPTNTLVMMGTSSFIIYDREGEMQTIISPLLPSIVKVLQGADKKEEARGSLEDENQNEIEAEKLTQEPLPVTPLVSEPVKKETPKSPHDALGAFILIAIITGLFVIIGIGTTTLFKSQPIVNQQVIHPDRDFAQALSAFPSVKYSFNRNSGRLLLVGHVLTASDKNQLIYNLQGINYIRSIDESGVIIDEGVWRELNQVISQNPNWKGISIQSPTPGHFVISGYLKSRKQAEQLWDYISSNFPYLDLLERRVIVEEDVVSTIGAQLQNGGFKDISAQMNEGDVVLSGNIGAGKTADFNKVLARIKEIPGVRNVKNFVAELAPEQSMVNITDKYEVSGISQRGSANTSVIINGRILSRGDSLDGMTISSIRSNAIFLEKDGVKYRIDYNR
jgi:type III secretion system YscD/HrpQ family protein